MSSFDSVNYAIRPNKTVERKIAFSCLAKIGRIIDLTTYKYVGLGSLWFVDFLMAHRLLGISSMVSIEQDQIGYRRSEFNRPLACIEVIHGETSRVVPDLGLECAPSIVWFDYDSSIGGPVLFDIEMLVNKCAANSIVLVTISGKLDDLPKKDENDAEISGEASLRSLAGDLVPNPLSNKSLQRKNYPRLLCEILTNQFESAALNSGREESFIKLFEIVYTDGTPMITVGGMMASPEVAASMRDIKETKGWEGTVQETINIPPLTTKEKGALDRTLPSPKPLTPAEMDKLGFPLKRDQIDAYHRHYLNYPTFGEFQF